MECAQINIVGGTGATKPSTVSFPGAYKGTDPGVKLSIYYPPVTNYIIPGPSVFSCSGGGGGNPQPTNPPASSTSTQPSTPSSTSPPPSGGAGQYEQCGGIGWTGATTCRSPYKCSVINEYYYQCVA